MSCCSKKCISLVTLIISVIVFVQTNILTIMILNLKTNTEEKKIANVEEENNEKQLLEKTEEWKIIIPKIKVETEIKEGTNGEIINNYVGHFEETSNLAGNIGLVAASAGYKENYFADLDNLVEGDVIIYIKGNYRKEYKVVTNVTIKQTDWTYLSKTKDNRLTLITGILEEPENRRCVQAIEIN